jgi:hypothetical protein
MAPGGWGEVLLAGSAVRAVSAEDRSQEFDGQWVVVFSERVDRPSEKKVQNREKKIPAAALYPM